MPESCLCACGCGEPTTIYRGKPRKFIAGHHARGANNGRAGKPVSSETRQKLSHVAKERVAQGLSIASKTGWKHSAEARKRMSEARGSEPRTPRRGNTHECRHCGRPYYRPQNVKETAYCSLRCSGLANCEGPKNPFFGKKHTPETKARLAELAAAQRARAPVLPSGPERLVHECLRQLEVGFLTEHQIGPFCVDIFIPDKNLVIFVDGCYWHACPEHFPKAKKPKTDNARKPYLTKCGYKVDIIWEHTIQDDPKTYLQNLLQS